MYHSMTGRLEEKAPTAVVLQIGGIGYRIQIPLSTYSELPPLGESVRLVTHFLVREDAQALYGFYTEGERDLFRQLIAVSGIGPKVAITALSGLSVDQLKQAIVDGALTVLTSIPGIGRKTAERIVVELREKIVLESRAAVRKDFVPGAEEDALFRDSLAALISLGYRRPNARMAVEKVFQSCGRSNLSIEEVIRASLKYV